MAPPAVTIYITSLTSQPKVRKHIDLLHRSLKGLEIPYESFDLVMDEQAKTRWQRAKPPGLVVGLPGYLVGGEWVGTMDDFEDAVETGTLETFLKQNVDIDVDSTTNKSGTIGEAELERLMREMTDGDLDKLAEQIGVESQASKVGLIDATPPLSAAPSSAAMEQTLISATSRKSSLIGGQTERDRKSRASLEEKAEMAREMMEAGTVDGLLKSLEKAEGKEKLD